MSRPAAVTVVHVLLFTLVVFAPARAHEGLLDHLAEIERTFHFTNAPSGPVPDLRARIVEIEGALPTPEDLPIIPTERINALNDFVFRRLGIKASHDLNDPDNVLPSRVLERRQGYCVGIAALYLILKDCLGLPIHAVATPNHVFLRYDDGATRINIETMQGGANISDRQYIREQNVPEASMRMGIFMRNLTTDEFLAQVHNNLGVVYSERKDYERAAGEYDRALDLDPRLPAAYYNYANDLLRTGEYRRAVRLFSKSLKFYPTDVWALNNRGLTRIKMGKREKARRDFDAALAIDPEFEPARRNLSSLQRPASSP